jgi:hypothetical protein
MLQLLSLSIFPEKVYDYIEAVKEQAKGYE